MHTTKEEAEPMLSPAYAFDLPCYAIGSPAKDYSGISSSSTGKSWSIIILRQTTRPWR